MCFAQKEREQIIDLTNNGLIAKLMKGQYANGGKLPFGILKDENHKVSFDPDKKKILIKMFELYKNCYSIQGITNKINKNFTLNLKYKQVVCILNNTIYFGYVIKAGTKYPIVETLINEDEYLELKSKLVNIESDNICIGNVEKNMISKDKHIEVIAYK